MYQGKIIQFFIIVELCFKYRNFLSNHSPQGEGGAGGKKEGKAGWGKIDTIVT